MRTWRVGIYQKELHTGPTWEFEVEANCKAMAISVAMWQFHTIPANSNFHRVEAELV